MKDKTTFRVFSQIKDELNKYLKNPKLIKNKEYSYVITKLPTH